MRGFFPAWNGSRRCEVNSGSGSNFELTCWTEAVLSGDGHVDVKFTQVLADVVNHVWVFEIDSMGVITHRSDYGGTPPQYMK